MKLKIKKNILKILFPVIFFICITVLYGCNQVAATIVVPPVTGNLPSSDTGTLYPMIQKVYPGTLQSLDIPQSYPSDISPEYPGIVVVFSHLMENGNNEMSSAIQLYDVTSGLVSTIISSTAVSSKYFTVTPESGSLNPDTEYILRIYKYASADTTLPTASVSRSGNRATIFTSLNHGLSDNEFVTISGLTAGGYNASMVPVTVISTTSFSYDNTGTDQGTTIETAGLIKNYSRTLVFENLVIPPAVTISPADPLYVEYKFITGKSSSIDITPPRIAFTNINNNDINIDPDPIAGVGYIEIIFYDNKIPMIDPSTVNDNSVTLYNTTSGIAVPGSITLVSSDTDFKTFRFYTFPDTYLLPLTGYRLSISVSGATPPYYITDFSGNRVTQSDIYFSTGL